jgi:hypothetical protein
MLLFCALHVETILCIGSTPTLSCCRQRCALTPLFPQLAGTVGQFIAKKGEFKVALVQALGLGNQSTVHIVSVTPGSVVVVSSITFNHMDGHHSMSQLNATILGLGPSLGPSNPNPHP